MPGEEITAEELQEIAGYAKSLATGTKRLSDNVSSLDAKIDSSMEAVDKLKASAAREMGDLKRDVRQLSDSMREVQKAMLVVIAAMKSAVKREDMQRLERRADAWAPHSLVTRREAERVILERK